MFREGLAVPFLGPGAVLEELGEESADGGQALPDLLPMERDLAQGIGKFAEVPEALKHNPLTILAQYGQIHMVGGRPYFYRQLKRHFPGAVRPGPVHRFLVQQEKPMLVVTACYDNLLEEIFREKNKKFVVVTHVSHAEDSEHLGKVVVQYSDRLDIAEICLSDELSIDLDEWWVFYKIQGTFDLFTKGLGGREEIDSIVISEEDYLSFVSRLSDQHRTIPALFNRPFQQRMITFLGYRLSDWNFRTLVHILRSEERMRKIAGYAVRKTTSEFETQYWKSKNVQIINCTVVEFVQGLAAEMGLRI